MKNYKKLETPDYKPYLVPLIFLCGIFLMASIFMVSGIRNHYYNLKQKEALKVARSYAHNLEKAKEAEEIIEELLEEKIRSSSQMAADNTGGFSNEFLIKLAKDLDIDELDYYDEEGVLRYSNLPEVIGWKVYDGHPIDLFLKGDQETLVEDLRQDVITGNVYKYGYLKLPQGGLIQVGLRADRVQSFLAHYQVEHLLKEMQMNQNALSISLLDQDLSLIATTKKERSLTLKEKDYDNLRASMENEKEYAAVLSEGDQLIYKVFVPLTDEDSAKILAISYTMEDTLETIRQSTVFSLIVLILFFMVLLYSIRVSYEKNRKLRGIAFTDSLTGLPNKEYFIEWSAKYRDTPFKGTLVLVNIMNFKHFNVAYGYDFGDLILQETARRLQTLNRKNLMIFKLSVDRFILLDELSNQKETYKWMVSKILNLFQKPLRIEAMTLPIQITLGGALSSQRGELVSELLKQATIALEEASKKDRQEMFYEETMMKDLQREDILLKELQKALELRDHQALHLVFQPIISGKTNEVIAFEALARMRSDAFGEVSPVEFIEIAERNQIIHHLSDCILDSALEFMTELRNRGYGHIRIAVNISGSQLFQENFSEYLLERLSGAGLRPNMLEVEITESVLLENFALLNRKLKKLRESGIRVALDDFGTGYSSFMRLQELSMDTIKIDKDFIRRINKSKEETLVSDMIQMAHRMELHVVAEGVEEKHQMENLIHFHCDALQGYYFSKPLSPENALKFLENFKEQYW